MRPAEAEVISPKVELVSLVVGVPKFAVLKALNILPRNWMRNRSLNRKFFMIPTSKLARASERPHQQVHFLVRTWCVWVGRIPSRAASGASGWRCKDLGPVSAAPWTGRSNLPPQRWHVLGLGRIAQQVESLLRVRRAMTVGLRHVAEPGQAADQRDGGVGQTYRSV